MELYITKDAANVINKTLQSVAVVPVTLKGKLDILNPTISLHITDDLATKMLSCNYCYIDEFKRYFFINDIKVLGKVVELSLEVDVLETYRSEILTSECVYNSRISVGDYNAVIGDAESREVVTATQSNVTLDDGNTVLLATVGTGV